MNGAQNVPHDLSINFNAYLCSCPDWQSLLLFNAACMHGLCAMTNNKTTGVLLAQASSRMIKHLPTSVVGSLYTCEYFCNHIAGTDITCLMCVFNFTLLANSPGVGWLSAGSMTSLFCACIAHKDLSVFQYALASDHCWSAVPWLLGSMFGTCNPHWTAVDLQSLSSL